MSEETICLTLEWFSKDDEFLVDDEDICIPLDIAFKISGANPKYDPVIADNYRITEKNILVIQPYYQHQMDLDKYTYFVSSYSDFTCIDGKVVCLDS